MPAPRLHDLLAAKGEAAPALRPEAPPRNPERFTSLRLRPPSTPAPAGERPKVVPLVLPSTAAPQAVRVRVGVTLRLDKTRHARFRAFAAAGGRTMQAILHEALEDYLARHDHRA